MVIRPMQAGDIPAILDMGKAMHHESAYRDMIFSVDKCKKLIMWLFTSPLAFIVVAVNDDGKLCGIMAAHIAQHYFSDDYMIEDYLLYVRPENRGGTIGMRLVSQFVEWAEKQNIKMIMCGISTEIETEKVIKLYKHFGFHTAGVLMRRNP